MHENILNEIRTLHLLGASLEATESIEGVLSAAAEAVARLLPCDRVSLIEIDRALKKVGFFARGGHGSAKIVTSIEYAELEDGLTGWVLQNGKAALSPKGFPDPRETDEVYQRRLRTDCGSIIVVPLQAGGEIFGTMTAINRTHDPDFTEQDVDVMEMFGDYCAIVIQNARNFIQLKKSNEEVRTLNKELENQNSLKDRFFTILAHDLRGPVGNTAMLLDLVIDEVGSNDERNELLRLGSESVHRTMSLLENLLNWGRNQMDGRSIRPSEAVIRILIDNAVGTLGPQAASKHIRVFVDCPGHLSITADAPTIETILRNLLSNAIKYSPQGSQILVRSWAEFGHVVIEVEDFGNGMSPETLASLFGQTKVDSKKGTAGERGNGLGMMFCAGLASSLGGKIEAESEPGTGSKFRLVLPAGESSTVSTSV